jgi:hypothetical protein
MYRQHSIGGLMAKKSDMTGGIAEWDIKKQIKKVFDSYPESYVYMSVPYGYGASTLDYLVCHYSLFIGIEAKRPGEEPTDRQRKIMGDIIAAHGIACVIDSVEACHRLRVFLEQVKQNATSPSKSQAPDGGSAASGKYPKPISRREALDTWRRAAHSPATSADGDVPLAEDGVRCTESDPDPLRLARGKAVRKSKKHVGDADAGAKSVRFEWDGDGED